MKKVDKNTLSEFIKDMLNPNSEQHSVRSKWHETKGLYSLLVKNIRTLGMFGLKTVVDDLNKDKGNHFISVKGPKLELFVYLPGDVWV